MNPPAKLNIFKKIFQVEFQTQYNRNLDVHNRNLSIAMGVLSALAVIYAGFLTANWNRRSGKMFIDFVTLFKFVLHFLGCLADAFLVVVFGWSLWWLIIYKVFGLLVVFKKVLCMFACCLKC